MQIQNVNNRIDNSRKVQFSAKFDSSKLKNVVPEIIDEFTALADKINPQDGIISASIQTVSRTAKQPRRYFTSVEINAYNLKAGRTNFGLKDMEAAIRAIRESLKDLEKIYS